MPKAGLPTHSVSEKQKVLSKIIWQELELKALLGQMKTGKTSPSILPRSRLHVWLIRASTTILLWTCLIQLTAMGELWRPHLLHRWPFCLDQPDSLMQDTYPPRRIYKNNGYLRVSCNGGLNQMRAAICDMVAIAKYLNVTLILPELDKGSFWADPSDFGDIFDVNHFKHSLRDQVRIIKELPPKFTKFLKHGRIMTMPPVSWSNESYYLNQILPLIKKHKVLHLNRTDARLANNNLPLEIQKLRCRVNYHSLRFTPRIEELGHKMVKLLRKKGPFLALHLRYEMDMLAFSGCTHGCTEEEEEELTRMRYAYPWWKEKVIDSQQKRKDGLCPLTPEETALILKALGFHRNTNIYIAAGEIYGSQRRMAALRSVFPNIVRKEMLLSEEDLKPFESRSSQMAALDYLVSVASDVFIPTYDGNMAKVVEGHRRYLGFRKTVLLDRRQLIQLIDQYHTRRLDWDAFSLAVQDLHKDRMGSPSKRRVILDRPKEEDYFYANPQECIPEISSPPGMDLA
ncbi:hypothetical protein O6H91_11G041300 [Diphasiastrum complanatum]|uniref:Uncharacterized protein n=2 Tax=Diphasiastrum complanatum TaxID=34168 RepID=A0ACC2C8E9_DIPCM|nr:hypothetical protein O6H91_11G041300 [Diphasiastrum complanatum]KAJ7538276.1 hypothetical protein O6H91_11G041300 [Diphasiastrum complanatum]